MRHCGGKLKLILGDTHPDIQLELSLIPFVSIFRNESRESRLFRLNMDLDIAVSDADGSLLAEIRMDCGNRDLSVVEGVGDPLQTHHWILISTIPIRCDLSFNCPRLKLRGNEKSKKIQALGKETAGNVRSRSKKKG